MSHQIYRKKPVNKAERFPIAFGAGKSVTSSRTSWLFNNGSTLDFVSQQEKMIAKFKAEDVYDHVYFPPGAVEGDIHEQEFELLEPTEFDIVTGAVAMQVVAQNVHNQAAIIATNAAGGFNANTRIRYLHDLAMEHSRRITAIHQSVPTLTARLEDARKTWTAERLKHDKKKAGCMKVFHDIFGPVTLAALQPHLSISHYRMAWFTVCTHNAQVNLGQANMTQMLNQLSSIRYNAATTTNRRAGS